MANITVILESMCCKQYVDISDENKDLWNSIKTEYGKENTTDDDITRKLALATLMHQGLTIENLSSYMHWGLWWQGSQGQSLIDLPSGNNSAYTLQPEYHAFKHYSAFNVLGLP